MRALKKEEELDPKTWELHAVEKIFYETDDLDTAFKKRRKAELTSNLDTDSEKDKVRRRQPTAKKLALDGCDSNSEAEKTSSSKLVRRPKTIKITPPIARRRSSSLNSHKSNSSISTVSTNVEGDELSHDVRTTSSQPISSFLSRILRSTNTIRASTNNTPAESTLSRNRPRDEAGQDVRFNENGFCLLLRHVLTIKEQNKQILALLTQIQPERQIDPTDFPYDLPLKSYDDVKEFEEYLKASKENCEKMISHLATLGGSGTVSKTNQILKHLISDLAASKFNYFGSRSNKKLFYKLQMKKIILSAVLKNGQGIQEDEVESAIKVWLKHAPQRQKNMLKKQTKNEDPEAQST